MVVLYTVPIYACMHIQVTNHTYRLNIVNIYSITILNYTLNESWSGLVTYRAADSKGIPHRRLICHNPDLYYIPCWAAVVKLYAGFPILV